MRPASSNVLMIFPRFTPHSFWNYQATCDVVGKRYSAAPLGLITVAALLPREWNIRLIDRNIEDFSAADIEWADIVMTGGMLPQQPDIMNLIEAAHAQGKPIVVGGPAVTSSPRVYDDADFKVIGEAEEVMDDFVAAWRSGATKGEFEAKDFPDMALSPVPRFDLMKLEYYMHVGMQLSRGCPFTCEFCDIIELYGRKPRFKSSGQMLGELEALRDLGYRGHVDFVDDNLIGNKKLVKPLLADLATWNEKNNYPFEFTTEASINLAEDDELLNLMKRANFFAVFVGIESPDKDTLVSTKKLQNTRRNISESIQKIYSAGIFVNAGFILGFDAEKGGVADGMVDCIEDSAIPVAMVGLLYALPNTALSRRLEAEGRLHAGSDRPDGVKDADQCTSGLNFTTLRPRHEILEDYRRVLRKIYEPRAFFERVGRMAQQLDVTERRLTRPFRNTLRDIRSAGRIVWRSGVLARETRGPFWRAVGHCLQQNPRAARVVFSQAALFLHYGPYSRYLVDKLGEQIETLASETGETARPLAAAPTL